MAKAVLANREFTATKEAVLLYEEDDLVVQYVDNSVVTWLSMHMTLMCVIPLLQETGVHAGNELHRDESAASTSMGLDHDC